MREVLKSTAGRLVGMLVFLTLPGCSLRRDGVAVPSGLYRGPLPHGSAIFCDIENRAVPRHCATDSDLGGVRFTLPRGIPLSRAALALTRGDVSNVGLDYSPAAIAALGCGLRPDGSVRPVAISFHSPYPDGEPVCLNCTADSGVIGPGRDYADARSACAVRCTDLNGAGSEDFCNDPEHARPSTNTDGACFDGACTAEGTLRTTFVDRRRTPEPILWLSLIDAAPGDAAPDDPARDGPASNTLTRTATTGAFAGAASSQTITHGDGYVEFTVDETNTERWCGLSTGAPPDLDPSPADIGFAIHLSTTGATGEIRISESGAPIERDPGVFSFGAYAAGDRLRVSVTDNFDGRADVTYSWIPAACSAGARCDGTVLRRVSSASYPFRVDASLIEEGATLTDVRIVRIR